jgi:hypothetical protein
VIIASSLLDSLGAVLVKSPVLRDLFTGLPGLLSRVVFRAVPGKVSGEL